MELFTRLITYGLSYAIVLQMESDENLFRWQQLRWFRCCDSFVCLPYSYISRLFALSHGMNEANSYRAQGETGACIPQRH